MVKRPAPEPQERLGRSGFDPSREARVRRTISPFATAPRDGTPFHILNTLRFNPLMERFEALSHHGDDLERRVWRPISFHCEPSVWLRRVPLPYEIPDDQWFPIAMKAAYLVKRRRSLLARMFDRLFRRQPKPLVLRWTFKRADGEWAPCDTDGSPEGPDRNGLDGEAATAGAGTASPNPNTETPNAPEIEALVERLLANAADAEIPPRVRWGLRNPDGPEAATALQSQAAECARLREALEKIAAFAPGYGDVCEIIAKEARQALSQETTP